MDRECLLLAKTRRQSHLRGTSAMVPGSDLLAAMSGFRLIPSGLHSGPDVAGATGIRRVLTLSGNRAWRNECHHRHPVWLVANDSSNTPTIAS